MLLRTTVSPYQNCLEDDELKVILIKVHSMSWYKAMVELSNKIDGSSRLQLMLSAVDNFFVDGVQYTSCW